MELDLRGYNKLYDVNHHIFTIYRIIKFPRANSPCGNLGGGEGGPRWRLFKKYFGFSLSLALQQFTIYSAKQSKKNPCLFVCLFVCMFERLQSLSSRWCHWHHPSGTTLALGSTQPLTEMSVRMFPGGWRRSVRRADNLTTFMCRLSWNLGASTFWNPEVPYRDCFTILLTVNDMVDKRCHVTNGTLSLPQETVTVRNKRGTPINAMLCCQLDLVRSSCQT